MAPVQHCGFVHEKVCDYNLNSIKVPSKVPFPSLPFGVGICIFVDSIDFVSEFLQG